MLDGRVDVTVITSCLENGGAEIALSHLLLGLNRDRFHPRLICLRREPGLIARELQSKGISAVFGLSQGKFDPLVGRRLVQRLAKGTDILYCLHHHNVLFWLPYLMHRVPVRASVLICHATKNSYGGSYFLIKDRPGLRYMQRIIAVANGQKRYLVEVGGLSPEQIEVIHNGISPADFADMNSQAADRDRIRRELDLADEHRVAMITGFLRPEKNHARFLRIARTVADRMPEARFVVVGDGPERSKLERYAQALAVAKVVRFVGVRRDVARLFAASDVVTLTSNEETFPLALLEGMAAARPVVATRVGSLDEMVVEGETGHLIAADDETAFANVLRQLLSDRVRAEVMGQAGRRLVLQNFTVEHMVRAHEGLFEQLLREPSIHDRSMRRTSDLEIS